MLPFDDVIMKLKSIAVEIQMLYRRKNRPMARLAMKIFNAGLSYHIWTKMALNEWLSPKVSEKNL